MQEKNTTEQMKLIISEREKRVRELEDELRRLKEAFYANFNGKEVQSLGQTTKMDESEFMKSRPMSSSRPNTGNGTPLPNRVDSTLEREVSSSRSEHKPTLK